jgi:8-amino-3,8-dideoxy-alpha-D-manno-octulosonate transaminase
MNVEFNPSGIDIEINGNCNMACSYCPNSMEDRKHLGEMPPELFSKIINQLRSLNYSGKISFHFYNEPLLSKNFDNYVKQVKRELPLCHIELYTNGTKINSKERLDELLEMGIESFVITKHEGIKKLKVLDLIEELPESEKIKFLIEKHEELYLVNRGGLLKGIGKKNVSNKTPCHIPSIMMAITVDGNVLPCFEDFKETLVMGNVKNSHIKDIWSLPRYVEFREDLLKGHRTKYDICRDCNRENQSMITQGPMFKIGDDELEAVKRVLEKKQLFRYVSEKSECDLFEEELCQKFGIEYAHMVTSGTNALVLAMQSAGIGPGDEVIIPSYTFVATAAAVIKVGAIPVVVNIDDQLGISLEETRLKITERTKAIIPVHMDGICCDMEKICELGQQENLIIIEDACQAFGAKFKGKHLGSWGDYGCFSFNQDKVVTCGEGGVVITKTKENYEKTLLNSDSGYSFSPMNQGKISEVIPYMGGSMRVSEISGAIMRVQMKRVDQMLEAYKIRKKIFLDKLQDLNGFEIIKGRDSEGECCVSLHLKFSDPIKAQLLGKKIRNHKIFMAQPTTRPAHCVWKWSALLGENASYHDKLNPYLNTDIRYDYSKKNYLASIDILYCILKMNIEISMPLNEVHSQAETLREILKGV